MAVYPGAVATDQDLIVGKDKSTSSLNGAINNSTTSIVVVDGTKFIAKEVISIESEQMQISSISTNTLTVYGRGYGGTAAASHADTTLVNGNITAKHHNVLKDEIIAIETALQGVTLAGTYSTFTGTSAGTVGRLYLQSDGPYTWRDNGSSWDAYIQGHGSVTVPPSTSWTWDNQGSSTIDSTRGFLYMHLAVPASGTKMEAYYRTAPSTPYTVKALFRHSIDTALYSTHGNSTGYGLVFRDGSGKLIMFRMGQTTPGNVVVNIAKWTDSSNYSADLLNLTGIGDTAFNNIAGLSIKDDGTNLLFYLSLDGQNWLQILSSSRTAWFASGPTQIGIGGYSIGAETDLALLSWNVA